ncbi:hypothetical protein O6H91_12G050300 [Diphasiastrum complanatum]|uniref:Uncharacterized protein n=1 Tax=Diphasiastrum complanatum TaxID=34168 RepID=A0ACC2C1K9_DIPCM|nr:hypothetical protein O6H91_12G050300 [Diphasiastrum complanatum]
MARLPAALLVVLLLVELAVFPTQSFVAALSEIRVEHQASDGLAVGRNLRVSNCPSACNVRCSQASKHKPCMKYCQLCCNKCLCVPPGYYGNKQYCPCYANLKNARGGPKCP